MVRYLRFWPPWRCAATGLCALGFALSAYLSWHYLMGAAVIGCGGGSPCEQVLGSRWSEIAGVLPVSGLAAGTYLAMLVCSFYLGPATAASDRRVAWAAMLVLAGAIAGSAVWFTVLQEWVIGAMCPYCMATHVAGLLLAALAIWRADRPIARVKPGAMRPDLDRRHGGLPNRFSDPGEKSSRHTPNVVRSRHAVHRKPARG